MINVKTKIAIIAGLISLTVTIHYGWVLEPLFGHSHWIHAIHGRFCYIPIVVAASLFGIKGGILAALAISLAVIPYIVNSDLGEHNFSGEVVEIIFYFAIGILTGAITEQVLRQRKKKEQAQLQLERSHRLSMIGQMAASVAHEIKNPLASIKGGVEIMANPDTERQDKTDFQNIVFNEISRLDNTIKEFLNFARPKEPEFKKVNISELLEDTLKQLSPQFNDKNLQLSKSCLVNVYVQADRENIRQVFINLALNAIEASPPGGKIVIALVAENSSAIFRISDNGPKIPLEDITHIFDPFYTTKSSGTGLGLAIVKSIVEKHNGTIELSNPPDKTFIVTLPLDTGAVS